MCKPNTRCLNCGEMFYKKPFRLKKENIHTCSRSCYGEYLHKLKIKEIEDRFNKSIKELLEDLYVNKMMSIRQIEKEIGLAYRVIGKWLKENNVSVRHGSEAIKTQWIDNDERRKQASEIAKAKLNSKENREKLKKIMQTEEYKNKQSISKLGSKNGMWRVCGENHHNWDVNRTHEKRCKERKTTKDHIWRSTVFARDNRTCCKCGKDKKARMVVHHINSYDIHENQRYDVDNGIVMCEDCHKDFHSKYGYGKNTRTQFEEYLKAD